MLTGRTLIAVGLTVILKAFLGINLLACAVLPTGTAGRADKGLDIILFAALEFPGFTISRVSHDLQSVHAQFLLGRCCHRTELASIIGVLHDGRLNDQMMLGIDRHLHVIANPYFLLTTAVWISQGYLALADLHHLLEQLLILDPADLELGNFVLQSLLAKHPSPLALAILLVHLAKIVFDARLNLLHQFLKLFLSIMAADVVYRFELAPVDCHQFGTK